ncbi:FtsW/RodA/SpoVE family cell cycle protein [Micrococcus sp. FDAARGOS_333]|uniref:FtsW/RodA/SpoVE family cell cycle protein n=1 Tax=Micrococcus sp. FDAARGOS_333 TaxID=1930558 RepID=UPI000B4E60D6|nr:FtsW/RodA/SpoVE family cell cycle protein [Micrococcus sp. FDAARGOS_333]PNL17077.1 FtsW/RodA/SpoVE family cell cycle protein [Micrococcus sp. FDAARGOS_333]
MTGVISPPHPRRNVELLLLVLALGIGLGANLLGAIGTEQEVTTAYWIQSGVLAAATLALHVVLRLRAPFADPYILPITVTLNGLGLAIIHRLETSNTLANATTQLVWTVVAMAVAGALLWFVRDHRLLRRWPYLFLAVSAVLLVLPLLPGIGMTVNGARIWVNLGVGTFQPGELAKITLAVFFAGYLSANRDLILLAGKKVGPLTFPRMRDLGPLVVAWLVALGVLVFQRDLGSALLFFGLFMAMLYIATSRSSWILLGLGLIGLGAVLAFLFMPHVTARFDVWLNAFDRQIYERQFGGSLQVVEGVFGMASGGFMGTGLGAGSPWRVPLNHSDMILATIGEELGFVGLSAVLVLYLLLFTRIMRAALGARDAFGKVLAAGLAFTLAWQLFVVAGGVMLVIPMTGLTTPFLAAGGSSLLANWIIVGLVLRISHSARRPVVVDDMVNASGPGAGHQDPAKLVALEPHRRGAGRRGSARRAAVGGDRA